MLYIYSQFGILHLGKPGILWSELRVATVVPAAAREWIVAALELAGHLLVGGASSRHQHHVEARQAKDWYRQYGNQAHQYHTICGG